MATGMGMGMDNFNALIRGSRTHVMCCHMLMSNVDVLCTFSQTAARTFTGATVGTATQTWPGAT